MASALLRKGSSRISEENFNSRLQREKAKTGAVTASLAWNDPSDLDLQANIVLAKGGSAEITYKNKQAAGGCLDVDMHARDGEEVPEPVENIFWKKPPAGEYRISVTLFKKRGARDSGVPFRVMLKRDGVQDESKEGVVNADASKCPVECFRFSVDDEGDATMRKLGTPLPLPKPAPAMTARKTTRTMKVMKVVKVSKVATGKNAKLQVFKGLHGKLKTKGGLKKEDLVKNKKGKIVSAKRSKLGKESKWAKATASARAIKGYKGFKAIKKGSSFYKEAEKEKAKL